jgi:hypothetical protein
MRAAALKGHTDFLFGHEHLRNSATFCAIASERPTEPPASAGYATRDASEV